MVIFNYKTLEFDDNKSDGLVAIPMENEKDQEFMRRFILLRSNTNFNNALDLNDVKLPVNPASIYIVEKILKNLKEFTINNLILSEYEEFKEYLENSNWQELISKGNSTNDLLEEAGYPKIFNQKLTNENIKAVTAQFMLTYSELYRKALV